MTELHSKVLIIGGGFSGIIAAIRLLDSVNTNDFHIYESNGGFGGTWWTNRYPGCAVDIPAFLYSLSTDPYKNWTKFFPPQDEILQYINGLVERKNLKSYTSFNSTVVSLDWDVDNEEWIAKIIQDGEVITHHAKLVLSGRGKQVTPSYPKIPGLEEDETDRIFKGAYLHSARYDTEISLKDKDVIVIGNGCSAAQIVPAIIDESKSVTQFIRSKHWLLPQPKFGNSNAAKWIINNIIGIRLARFLLFVYLEATFPMFQNTGIMASIVRNHFTREAKAFTRKTAPAKYHNLLIPDYKLGCKRRIFDDGYLKCLNSDKILLTDDPVVSVTEDHVLTKSGKSYHADVIIAATGFDIQGSSNNIPIYGLDKTESLIEFWERTGPSAYNVCQITGYPNLFYIVGPNGSTGHSSLILQIENILTYIEKVAGYVLKGTASSVDVKPEAYQNWKELIRDKSVNGVYMKGGCSSWFVKDGFNVALYPWNQFVYWYKAVFPEYEDQNYHWIDKNEIQANNRKWGFVSSFFVAVVSGIIYKFI